MRPEYKKLIESGITSRSNLPDLNDMTDRGENPLKPFTASKTVGVMSLIKKYNIRSEEEMVKRFEQHSRKSLEVLTDEIFEHQKVHFGNYRYNRKEIFKYVYCCVVINSLKGYSTESMFDRWALNNGILTRRPTAILDEGFHTDRIEVDSKGRSLSFISVKPEIFSHNYEQYEDVFAGLEYLSQKYRRPWKVFYRKGNDFKLLGKNDLEDSFYNGIKMKSKKYRI